RLSEPDIHLGAGSGSHAEQTARVMMAYEKIVIEKQPDMVVVVGDVNSTIACTLASAKILYDALPNRINYKVDRPVIAHLEAGLRSFDRTMPEEVNRIATDVLADLLWTPSEDGDANLLHEGVAKDKIVRVGNIMIDSLEMMREHIVAADTCQQHGLMPQGYAVVTLHRPSNVDNPETLVKLCELLMTTAQRMPVVFPVHPRTRKNLENHQLLAKLEQAAGITLLDPQSYINFMNLVFNARLVITDSGGIQEETTYLGIPCLTLRPNTERPATIEQGTNVLCTTDSIKPHIDDILAGKFKQGKIPEFWDGNTAARVVDSIRSCLS
ncbi:MAG: UDP-N-acetylglucosamine 2-epimerase (non-hydrolyzing), partial [Gammaproteobacteria bacterium]|nr:UDP-N-acetylglucosamine 2-epimerase (non-hydrolyzing) [Gammaproteobacteria bacterium]